MSPDVTIWIVAAIATAGVILRPFNLPEATWAVRSRIAAAVKHKQRTRPTQDQSAA